MRARAQSKTAPAGIAHGDRCAAVGVRAVSSPVILSEAKDLFVAVPGEATALRFFAPLRFAQNDNVVVCLAQNNNMAGRSVQNNDRRGAVLLSE